MALGLSSDLRGRLTEAAWQRNTLMEYVEQFQQVEAAMVLAKVGISDRRKTLQFIKGIKDVGYRRFILEKSTVSVVPLKNSG
eukprot:2808490-Rhodomonas_salina.1